MSKRIAKKKIGAVVATAIDRVMMMDLTDDQVQNRVNALFNVYEDAMARINASATQKGRSEVKKYFSDLYNDVVQQVTSATAAK